MVRLTSIWASSTADMGPGIITSLLVSICVGLSLVILMELSSSLYILSWRKTSLSISSSWSICSDSLVLEMSSLSLSVLFHLIIVNPLRKLISNSTLLMSEARAKPGPRDKYSLMSLSISISPYTLTDFSLSCCLSVSLILELFDKVPFVTLSSSSLVLSLQEFSLSSLWMLFLSDVFSASYLLTTFQQQWWLLHTLLTVARWESFLVRRLVSLDIKIFSLLFCDSNR